MGSAGRHSGPPKLSPLVQYVMSREARVSESTASDPGEARGFFVWVTFEASAFKMHPLVRRRM